MQAQEAPYLVCFSFEICFFILSFIFFFFFIQDGGIGSPEFSASNIPFSPQEITDLNFPDSTDFHNILSPEASGGLEPMNNMDTFARYFPNSYVSSNSM